MDKSLEEALMMKRKKQSIGVEQKGKWLYLQRNLRRMALILKLYLDDWLVMGSNLETASLHMQG